MHSADYAIFRIREELNDLDKSRRGESGHGGVSRSKRQLRKWVDEGAKIIRNRGNKEADEVVVLQLLVHVGNRVLDGKMTARRALRIFDDPERYSEQLYLQQEANSEPARKFNRTAQQLLELTSAYRQAGSDLDAWYTAGKNLRDLITDPDVSAWGEIGLAPTGATARAKWLYEQHFDRAAGYVEAWKKHPRVREETMPNQPALLDPVSVGIMRHMTPEVRATIASGGSPTRGNYDIEYERRSLLTFRNVAIGFGVVTGIVAIGLTIRAATR